jgi:hypothetical protein
MKYSQSAGIISAMALVAICYLPWVYISSVHTTVTGLHAEGTSFGKPGILNVAFAGIAIIFFSIPKIWAKRGNVFIVTINFAWAMRNYLLLSTCQGGECPDKKAGIYLLVLASLIMLVMSFFPTVKLPKEK